MTIKNVITEHAYSMSYVKESLWASQSFCPIKKAPLNLVRYILNFNKQTDHLNIRKTCQLFKPIFPFEAHINFEFFTSQVLDKCLEIPLNFECFHYDVVDKFVENLTDDKLAQFINKYEGNKSHVRSVSLTLNKTVSCTTLEFLGRFPLTSLKINNVNYWKLTDWTFLQGMQLKTLEIRGVPILNDEALKTILVMLPRLQDLALINVGITDQGMDLFRNIPLKKLNLAAKKITDEGMKTLATIKTLTHLTLSDLNISDDGIEYLTNLRLKELQLCGGLTHAYLSDRSITHLKTMPLVTLKLENYPNITIACWDDLNTHRLKSLKASGTGIDELVQALNLKRLLRSI